ncbi:MAG: DUF695 domain-containing protein [Planctomycetes bacterium]|nr:DUF695 domain-containing protein [Planctomycetota bacterium]
MVDGVLSSIFVDLGLRDAVPQPERPFCLRVGCRLQRDHPRGMSHADEVSALDALEKSLVEVVADRLDGVYEARITGGGGRRFYFHVARDDVEILDACLAHVRASAPDHPLETDIHRDPGWRVYLDFLYPNRLGFQFIRDTHTIEALREHGDSLGSVRDVDHVTYFGSEEAARGFASRVARDDRLHSFVLRGIKRAEERHRWSVELIGRHAVDHRTIEPITSRLVRLAEEFCGDYDGWGCTIQAP